MREIQQPNTHTLIHMYPLSSNPGFANASKIQTLGKHSVTKCPVTNICSANLQGLLLEILLKMPTIFG